MIKHNIKEYINIYLLYNNKLMTRDTVLQEVLDLQGNNFLLELPTGTGKSKIALEKIKSLNNNNKNSKLLIVVPRNVHKDNWKDEINKWWHNNNLIIEYTTYVSFPKYKGTWDYIIFDECHHLSERCRDAICDFTINHSILLSATVSKTLKDELREVFDNLVLYKLNLREVIEGEILPDPKVYLWPLELNVGFPTEAIFKNPKAKGTILECNWKDRWAFIKQKNHPVRIYCTERQYYSDLTNQIEYWKKRYLRLRSTIAKNKWLKLCSDRLKWLSDKKVKHLHKLLPQLINYRTLTFCNSIEQTEILGEYCINSRNNNSIQNLQDFNNGKINHITACSMLNEGMNLTNCQIGIYANLNSSETIVKQRTGRLLRHPNPVIIIPYFKNTREEELVQKMLEDYNPELITTITNIKSIKI